MALGLTQRFVRALLEVALPAAIVQLGTTCIAHSNMRGRLEERDPNEKALDFRFLFAYSARR